MPDYIQAIKNLWGLSEQETDGYTEGEIAEAEKRLGIAFPKALRDYYRALGKRDEIHCGEYDGLLALNRVNFDPYSFIVQSHQRRADDPKLVIYMNDQQEYLCYIAREDLKDADPKVWIFDHEDLMNKEEDCVYSYSVSKFLLALAYNNAKAGGLAFDDIGKNILLLEKEVTGLINGTE